MGSSRMNNFIEAAIALHSDDVDLEYRPRPIRKTKKKQSPEEAERRISAAEQKRERRAARNRKRSEQE